MVNRTIYNLKTLQIKPTNRLYLKGLLTYRTIQFSMSSGCCHPKKLLTLAAPARFNFRAVHTTSNPAIAPAIQGTKNPSADLITLNSASQTFVNSQPLYQGRAGCQRLSFFFCRCCALATPCNLPVSKRLSKTILSFFRRQNLRFTKKADGRIPKARI